MPRKRPATPAKRGRPLDREIPRQPFYMRLHPHEQTAWQAEADALGMTLAAWIRMTCNRAVRPEKK